jgi:hypothetical protein
MFIYSNNDSAYLCIFIVIGSHAEGHENTNVPLILKVCDVIFCMLEKQIIGHFVGFFEGVSMCFSRIKNNLPNFRITGTLIVNILRMEIHGVVHDL